MDYSKKQKILDAQPFYVVTDDAYDRMMDKLLCGERYVKTYSEWGCPHSQTTNDCKCSFNLNFLKEGKIVRANKGIIKPVIKLSDL